MFCVYLDNSVALSTFARARSTKNEDHLRFRCHSNKMEAETCPGEQRGNENPRTVNENDDERWAMLDER